MYCRRCGSEVDDTSNYCRYCGESLRSEDLEKRQRKLHKETVFYTAFSIATVLFFVVCIFIIQNNPSFKRQESEVQEEQTSQVVADTKVTKSSKGVSEEEIKLGSAKILEGDTILITTFVEVKGDAWTKEDEDCAKNALKEAVKWIEQEGRVYGKEINFIYDVDSESDLRYDQSIDYSIDSESVNTSRNRYYVHNKVWIRENIDVASIKEKYGTDNIGYLFLVKDKGLSYTYTHYLEDRIVNKEEMCTIYLIDSSYTEDYYETAATYAHEILHLYGALDLYEGACPEHINDYVIDTYPYEIMLSTYDETLTPNEYGEVKEISSITAYMLSWIDEIEELTKFPEMIREEAACFSQEDYGGYRFDDTEEDSFYERGKGE
ncbi:zinc ribbon domain-containing protein [Anaerosporobacter sp.]|uniref:zinc ribbon domain-containing protein n=1 Tax=Anaerosporobacter sp. TaxID=1872529 RepID=UPI00286ED208|nr:zinc ribbon domain-containing protein [Anaerosporobacter sp.]